jgi:hypothetical protein
LTSQSGFVTQKQCSGGKRRAAQKTIGKKQQSGGGNEPRGHKNSRNRLQRAKANVIRAVCVGKQRQERKREEKGREKEENIRAEGREEKKGECRTEQARRKEKSREEMLRRTSAVSIRREYRDVATRVRRLAMFLECTRATAWD